MSTKDLILRASARSEELIKILGETDYAPSALHQSAAYVKELEVQIPKEADNAKKMGWKLSKEQSEHEKMRDSRVKRLAYKMGGKKEKFAAEAEKEEREYHDALQTKFQADQKLETLKKSLKEAKNQKVEYEQAAARHTNAQVELDALYNSIFAGPTPDFPEEDAAEQPVSHAQYIYNEVAGRLNTESQVVQMLSDADKKMNLAGKAIQEALSASRADMWGFGGGFADMHERSAMSAAQSNASHVEMLVSMARNTQPLVQPLPPIEIAQGNFMSDVLFDNIFSDLAFHDKIKASEANLRRAHLKLQEQLKASCARLEGLKTDARRAEEVLQTARRSLQGVRQEAFRRVASGGYVGPQQVQQPQLGVALPPSAGYAAPQQPPQGYAVPPTGPPPSYAPPSYQ